MKIHCNVCAEEIIWGGDDDSEEGIVSNYTCTNNECLVDTIIIYTKI